MAHDIFISHSTKDKPVADAVCAKLEAEGLRCWIAPRDILAGMDWGGSIIEAIETARLMVLVLSASADTSPQILREVERAVNKGLRIVPLRIEDIKVGKNLEYFLGSPHWLDAITPPLEAHLQYLAQTAKVLLDPEHETREAAVPPPPPAPTPIWVRLLHTYLMNTRSSGGYSFVGAKSLVMTSTIRGALTTTRNGQTLWERSTTEALVSAPAAVPSVALSPTTPSPAASQTPAVAAVAPTPAAGPTLSPMNRLFLVTHSSPVYANPDASTATVAHIHRGRHVHVTGPTGDWLQVKINGTVGFIPDQAVE